MIASYQRILCNLAELTTLGNTCIIQAWDPHQFLIHFSMEIGQIFHNKCILKMFWTHLASYPLYHGNWPWWNNMMICKASSEENRTVQYPVWMTRKLRKGDFMEGDLEIRTGGGGRGRSKEKFLLTTFIPFLSTSNSGGWVPPLHPPLIMLFYITCRNKSNVPWGRLWLLCSVCNKEWSEHWQRCYYCC